MQWNHQHLKTSSFSDGSLFKIDFSYLDNKQWIKEIQNTAIETEILSDGSLFKIRFSHIVHVAVEGVQIIVYFSRFLHNLYKSLMPWKNLHQLKSLFSPQIRLIADAENDKQGMKETQTTWIKT